MVSFTIGDTPLAAHETIPRRTPLKLDNNGETPRELRTDSQRSHSKTEIHLAAVRPFPSFPRRSSRRAPLTALRTASLRILTLSFRPLVKRAIGTGSNLESRLEIEAAISNCRCVCTSVHVCIYMYRHVRGTRTCINAPSVPKYIQREEKEKRKKEKSVVCERSAAPSALHLDGSLLSHF